MSLVRSLFEGLISPNAGERQIAAKSAQELDSRELAELLRVLDQHVRRELEGRAGVDGLLTLIEVEIPGAVQTLLAALSVVPPSNLDPSIAYELQTLLTNERVNHTDALQLLGPWSESKTGIGAAAKHVLKAIGTSKGVAS
jgi:hypothetical protein